MYVDKQTVNRATIRMILMEKKIFKIVLKRSVLYKEFGIILSLLFGETNYPVLKNLKIYNSVLNKDLRTINRDYQVVSKCDY